MVQTSQMQHWKSKEIVVLNNSSLRSFGGVLSGNQIKGMYLIKKKFFFFTWTSLYLYLYVQVQGISQMKGTGVRE